MSEHVDNQVLAELQTLMQDDFTLLLETYLTESSRQFDQARAACDRGDTDSLRRSAHSLKGSSLNIGAHRLARLCAELEAGADVDGAKSDRTTALKEVLERTSAELAAVLLEVRQVRQVRALCQRP